MFTLVIASLRTHGYRYVGATIAIAVSVAFVVVIGILMAAARSGLMNADGAPYRGADVVIRSAPEGASRSPSCCPGTLNIADAIGLVDRLGENASALGRVLLPAHTEGGAPLGANDSPGITAAGPLAAPALRWQTLVSGRFPTRIGEAVVHAWDAQAWGVGVGDRIRLGEGPTAADLLVVGLVDSPSTWTQASVYVTWSQYLAWRDLPTFNIGSIAVRGNPGRLPDGMRAQPVATYVTESLTRLDHDVDVFGLMLSLFASVAVLVSALVIANTFSMLFARRSRELALLRCLGATGRQVRGSIRWEALLIGTAASVIGVFVGIGLGYGLAALVNTLGTGIAMGTPALPWPWLFGGFAVGVSLTLLASWVPLRRMDRLSPLAALGPAALIDTRTSEGRLRVVFATAFGILGCFTLGLAILRLDRWLLLAGGIITLAGVLVPMPVLLPRLARIVGPMLGTPGQWAVATIARDPRRAAATAIPLFCSIALLVSVSTGLATWRSAVTEHRDTQLPIDIALTAFDMPIDTALFERIRHTRGVAQAAILEGVVTRVDGWEAPIVIATAPATVHAVARDGGAFAQVTSGKLVLDHDAFRSAQARWEPGARVLVQVGQRRMSLDTVLLGGWGHVGLVAPNTLARLADTPTPRVVWIRAADDADRRELVGDLGRLAHTAKLDIDDRLQARSAGDRQWVIVTGAILGLLGVSVAIAWIGIANTLALSVLDHAHEYALLRAIGLTRGRLRRLLAIEALLLSLLACVPGAVLGIALGWVACATVVAPILKETTLHIPWFLLGLGLPGMAAIALLASVLPARRANALRLTQLHLT